MNSHTLCCTSPLHLPQKVSTWYLSCLLTVLTKCRFLYLYLHPQLPRIQQHRPLFLTGRTTARTPSATALFGSA